MAITKQHNVTLDAYAESDHVNHFTWNGSGQSSKNYYQSTDTTDLHQIGLQINHRQGPNYTANSITGVGDNEIIHFNVNAGAQPGQPTKAEWSFNYSIGNATPGGNLADAHFKLLIDTDPSANIDYLVLDSYMIGGGPQGQGIHMIWLDKNGAARIQDDGQNPSGPVQVSQNSQNLAFYLNDINHGHGAQGGNLNYKFTAGTFDIVLEEVDMSGGVLHQVHTQVHVGP